MGITFVIPAYNAERTIGRTLQSLAAQTTGDWTAVVVDDGSTDGTAAIADAWSHRDQRVQVVSQPNGGVSSARNAGLGLARGELLCFLDADDTVDPGYSRQMSQSISRRTGAGAACCGSLRLSSTGKPIQRLPAPRLDLSPHQLCRRYAPAPLDALVVRRDRVLGVGGFDPTLQGYEDWDFWRKLVDDGVCFAVQHRLLAHYWCTPGSLTSKGPQMLDGFRAVLSRRTQRTDALQAEASFGPASEEAEFEAFLWSVGLAIGQSRDPMPLVESWSPPGDLPIHKHRLSHALLRGLAVGHECRTDQFVDHWPAVEPGILRLIKAVEISMARPGAAYALLKSLEREVLRGRSKGRPLLTSSIGVTIDMRLLLRGLRVDPTADSAMIGFRWARKLVEVPLWGGVGPSALHKALLSEGLQSIVKGARWDRLAAILPQQAGRAARRMVRAGRRLRGARHAPLRQQASDAVSRALPSSPAAAIVEQERRRIEMSPPDATAPAPAKRKPEPTQLTGEDLVAAWEDFYETADPWDYGSAYEQLKYARTLSMIPDGPVGRALELGCSEGRFTQLLAGRADRVRALDISQTALSRAAERCSTFDNLEFRASDVFAEPIQETWDLITAAEMIYHIEDLAALPDFAGRLRDALVPGGHLIQTHAFDVAVNRGRTGFDWSGPIDGEVIAAVLRDTPGLQHVRVLTTDLYRIDLFRRSNEPSAPVIETVPLGSALEPAVESGVIWNGAIALRAEVEQDRAYRVPVLMYHRISDDGPEALAPYRVTPRRFAEQLRFLRRRGFRSLAPDEWQARHLGGSLLGRPVMITFDDAYQDFADAAWPLLRRSGFGAHVFVPTDLVGASAVWDERSGPPARLMDWPTIARLAGEGVTFGSHLATHTRADYLDSTALLREAARSRFTLEAVLGRLVNTAAPPFGVSDQRIRFVLAQAGYRQVFADSGGPSPVFGMSLATPRIEIDASDTLESFALKVGMAHHPPDHGDVVAEPCSGD